MVKLSFKDKSLAENPKCQAYLKAVETAMNDEIADRVFALMCGVGYLSDTYGILETALPTLEQLGGR